MCVEGREEDLKVKDEELTLLKSQLKEKEEARLVVERNKIYLETEINVL